MSDYYTVNMLIKSLTKARDRHDMGDARVQIEVDRKLRDMKHFVAFVDGDEPSIYISADDE